eukprot:1441383-Pleurochrysis_carterae.AAC.1
MTHTLNRSFSHAGLRNLGRAGFCGAEDAGVKRAQSNFRVLNLVGQVSGLEARPVTFHGYTLMAQSGFRVWEF